MGLGVPLNSGLRYSNKSAHDIYITVTQMLSVTGISLDLL
jgi:hypothetical protein